MKVSVKLHNSYRFTCLAARAFERKGKGLFEINNNWFGQGNGKE